MVKGNHPLFLTTQQKQQNLGLVAKLSSICKYKLSVVQMMISVFDSVERIMVKKKMSVTTIFSHTHTHTHTHIVLKKKKKKKNK